MKDMNDKYMIQKDPDGRWLTYRQIGESYLALGFLENDGYPTKDKAEAALDKYIVGEIKKAEAEKKHKLENPQLWYDHNGKPIDA